MCVRVCGPFRGCRILLVSPRCPFFSCSSLAVRLEEQIDLSVTTKFVYVHWMGTGIGFAVRGRFGVVHGSIQAHFAVSNAHTVLLRGDHSGQC